MEQAAKVRALELSNIEKEHELFYLSIKSFFIFLKFYE